jgi:hypothetical protein
MKPSILKSGSLLSALFLILCSCSNDVITSSSFSIRVTQPESSSIVNAGTTCDIRWSMTGTADDAVRIDLYSDTGFVQSIATSAPNTGSFSWQITSLVPRDTASRIKITGAARTSVFGFSGTFTIVNNIDSYEPDGSPSEATVISTAGEPQSHRISASDTDWFRFDAVAGMTYCIQTAGNARPTLRLYGTNATTLLMTGTGNGAGNNALIIWTCGGGAASSGTCYFKVTAPSQSCGEDYVINVRSGGAILAITNPNSETRGLLSGSGLSITWAYSANTGNAVSLDLFREDTLAVTISSGAVNNGFCSWSVPWTLPTSSLYRIKIVCSNDTSVHDLSDRFTITHIPTSLVLTMPTASSHWNTGSTYSINWTYTGNFGQYVKIDLYDSATFVSTISSSLSIQYNPCSWTIPSNLGTSTAYRIKISSTSDSSIFDFSDTFTIIHIPVTLTLTMPSAATNWTSGSADTVKWTYTGNPGNYVTLTLYDSTGPYSTSSQIYSLSSQMCIWNIPLTVPSSSLYRLKIASTTDTSVYDFSDPFTITKLPATMTLTTPSASTSWNTGTTYSIYWTYTGNPGTSVNLSLWDSSSSLRILTIANSTPVTGGTCSWAIPPTIFSGNYRIKITSMQDSSIASYSSLFRITNIPTTISVIKPDSTSQWNAGSQYVINWTSTGSPGTFVNISLYNDTSLVSAIASSSTSAGGMYQWTVPSTLPGGSRYRIKIASNAYPTIADYSDYFTIVPLQPKLTITTPGATSSWNTGTSYTIYWTATGATGPYVKLELFDSSSFVQIISASQYATAYYFSWVVPSTLHTGSRYRIKITSLTQDTVFGFSSAFTITNIPEVITVSSPAASAIVNAGTSIYVYWNSSGPVPGSYVSVSLIDSSGAVSVISSSVYRTNAYYVWSIPATLAGGGTMRVRVASTVDTTVAGYSGAFTIVPVPPSLTITSPDTLTSWTTGYNYTIYWSYAGTPGANVRLELYDTSALVQTISQSVYTTNGNFLWYVPTSLKTGTRYRVKIASTTKDSVFGFSRYFQIVSPSSNDAYEPDSTSALAKPITVGAAAQSHSLTAGDRDWLSFSATAGTTYTIQTFGSTDTYLNLFSTDGTTLLTSDDDSGTGPGLNAKIVWTCTTSGTYYFEVTSSFGGIGNYTVSVQ